MATIAVQKNSRELVARIEEASQKWGQYLNNLDELLGIKTINSYGTAGLYLSSAKELCIGQDYDWYITDKHPEQEIFKVVGLHKKDVSKNLVYLLGKNEKTEQPFLVQLPVQHMDSDWAYSLSHVVSDEGNRMVRELVGLSTKKEEAKELVGVRAMKVNVPTLTYTESDVQPTGIYVKSDGHLGNWIT